MGINPGQYRDGTETAQRQYRDSTETVQRQHRDSTETAQRQYRDSTETELYRKIQLVNDRRMSGFNGN